MSLKVWQERFYGDGSLSAVLDDLWAAVAELGRVQNPSTFDVTACVFARRSLKEASERLADMERAMAYYQDGLLDLVLDDLA